MRSAYDELSKQCDDSIKFVKKLGGFEGSSELLEKTLDLLEFYKDVTEHQFYEILDIFLSSGDKIAPTDILRMKEIAADISKRGAVYLKKLKDADNEFRKKYNLVLVIIRIEDVVLLLVMCFILWILPVKFIGKFFETERNGVFSCSGAAAVSVAIGHAIGLIAAKSDYLHFDYTIIIKVLLSALVFKLYLGTNYWKGLAISGVFWLCVFISTYYIYLTIYT